MPKKKLKIAVQLFGHLRTYEKCAPDLFRYMLGKYDCDFFIHTWTKLNHNTQTWHANAQKANDTDEGRLRRVYPNIKKMVIEEQHPVDLGIAHFAPNYKDRKHPSNISIFGMGAMFYTMEKANALREQYQKEHKTKYDFVLCIRPDILLKRDIDLEKMLDTQAPKDIDNGFFTFANAFSKVIRGFQNFGVTDGLFFARPAVMDEVFKHLPNIQALFKPDAVYNYGPEYEMIKSIQGLGYITYRVDYKYKEDWEILRVESQEKLRRRLIRFRFKNRKFYLWLFPKMLPPIFNFQFNILGRYTIDFSLGNPQREI